MLVDKYVVRFQKKVLIREDGCHVWQGGKKHVWTQGGTAIVARYAYQLATGIDPGKLNVLHMCDNPRCVNHKHLFLGTHLENMQDRERKSRGVRKRGREHHANRLSATEILEVERQYREDGLNQYQLAEQWGISQPFVSQIIRRDIKWLFGDAPPTPEGFAEDGKEPS